MAINFVRGALLFVAGLSTLGSAQTPDQNPPNSVPPTGQSTAPVPAVSGGYLIPGSEPDEASSYWSERPSLPGIIGGYGSALGSVSTSERSNYVRGGITLQATYDDNALLSNPAVSNYTYSIFPQITLDQSRTRLRWLLDYAGGFTYNQQLSNQNQTSQNLNFDLEYRISPHVSMRISEGVNLTTGLFTPVNSYTVSVPGLPEGTNPLVLTPLSKQIGTTTVADISYQFSATDAFGASGSFSLLHFYDISPGTTLIDTQTENAAGYYMHRIGESNWMGVSYMFEHLGYSPVVDDTVVHSPMAFDTWRVNRSISISFFAGPQYSENRLQPSSLSPAIVYANQWSPAGGASLTWRGKNMSLEGSYVHRITGGGGLQGSVQSDAVTGSFRGQLTKKWSLGIGGAYSSSNSIVPTSFPSSSLTYASGSVSVTRQLCQNCYVQVGYTRQQQDTAGLTTITNNANRNNVIASFSYQFARPWGR